MYRQIDFKRVTNTLEKLNKRIEERFPKSGLVNVCNELRVIASETDSNLNKISLPNYWLRGLVAFVISISISIIIYSISSFEIGATNISLAEILQVAEAAVNDIILIGLAIFFLISLESRVKRSSVLKSLNELRVIAHVIDMHQLTKDPTEIGESKHRTASSPQRNLTPYSLKRYLDYSSEMLAIVGKIAAVYAQNIPDPQVVSSVNEVENLTSGISRKIWQKIMILQERE